MNSAHGGYESGLDQCLTGLIWHVGAAAGGVERLKMHIQGPAGMDWP
jgi:hypothetical protein